MDEQKKTFTDEEALHFHRWPTPGKIGVQATKPMATQRDLSLAYSPGVAVPVHAIAADPELAYEYTSKGNMVAVISNGTAILGLGDLGALASKPVMEGKSVLFKRFADVDSIDIEVATKDPDELITVVKNIGLTFGGINLEDIKSPECFIVEQQLQELLDVPVFHDDQHGTAIITAAGLINACHITGRRIEDVKVVLNGPGAAGIATLELIKAMGVRHENVVAVDRKGVLWTGRPEDMNQWKSAHAIDTPLRTLEQALVGADCFIGLSVKGAVTPEMIRTMGRNPIIFAMANPDPEITPEEVAAVRGDAIVATGRSDYPNQVNNVLGFPYIFRGALDVRARRVNHEMKIACAQALARLAREDVPDEVAAAYGRRLKFGPEYIIPTPFDPRLISYVPPFVAQAAMDTGVARQPIADMAAYRERLAQRLDPTAAFLQKITGAVQAAPNKRVVFAEGEDPSVIRAACAFEAQGLGHAILVGREELILENMRAAGVDPADCASLEIINARLSERNGEFVDHLYGKLQRQGFLRRDVQRLVNQDRNSFAASMLSLGYADALVTGVTRAFDQALAEVSRVIPDAPDRRLIGMTIVMARGQPIFVADTTVTEFPTAEDLADIAVEAARAVRNLGYTPRVAFLSYSSFGNPPGERGDRIRRAVCMLDARGDVGFEYDGEMSPDIALDPASARANYPFLRLSEPANVLIMPAIHSASIATRLVQSLGGATVIGPLLLGASRSIQIAPLSANVSQLLTLATFAAYDGVESNSERRDA
jgi:malate dehydrogenase (oxaloacetate-decarboxylating)(NADP+)